MQKQYITFLWFKARNRLHCYLSGKKIPKTVTTQFNIQNKVYQSVIKDKYVYKHTFLGFTGTCKSISQFLNKSCIKEPVQQPAATMTAFLLYIVLLEVWTALTSPLISDLTTEWCKAVNKICFLTTAFSVRVSATQRRGNKLNLMKRFTGSL